jgi:hypothetical protein
LRVVGKQGGRERARQAPADEKTGNADGELLQEERDQGAEETETEREEQGKPKRWIVAQVRRELEADRKSERGDEKPEKAATKEKKRDPDKDADDRQGEIHPASLAIKGNHG